MNAPTPMTEATGLRIVVLLERIADLLDEKDDPRPPWLEPRFDRISPKRGTRRDDPR